MMKFQPVRRILTSHEPNDTDGTSVVVFDDAITLAPGASGPGGHSPVYSSVGLPIATAHSTTTESIANELKQATTIVTPQGTNGRIVEMMPGGKFGMHRTNSVDYDIFVAGSAYLVTPSPKGEMRTLCKAGDIVVQRGTLHAWEAGPEGARWFSVVIAAKPVVANGLVLEEVGLD
jgi:hypothetical protein